MESHKHLGSDKSFSELYIHYLVNEKAIQTNFITTRFGNATSSYTDDELLGLSEKLSHAIGKSQHREALELLKTMIPEYHCEMQPGFSS